ncbi:MAG: hypothetical protein AB8H86_29345 [Polyangiales bacterium]
MPTLARAEVEVETLETLHDACHSAPRRDRAVLYTTQLENFRFQAHDARSGVLAVDTRHNFRILEGAAELFPSGLESIAFPATRDRAGELRRYGRKIRVGFFLAFDGGQACLVRPAAAVTTVRIDVAFVELLNGRGQVLAREDTERLRAWRDDDVPEPGLSFGELEVQEGDALVARTLQSKREALSACFSSAVSRGASRRAVVTLRLRVAGGRIAEVATELSSLGDREGVECLRTSLLGAPANGAGQVRVPLRHHAARRARSR